MIVLAGPQQLRGSRHAVCSEEYELAEVLNTGDAVVEQAGTVDAVEPAQQSKWYHWRRDGKALISYLLDSEVHTFAFSVAANAILSFIPFIVLLYTLARVVFHSDAMRKVIDQMVNYYLPTVTSKDWLTINLKLASEHQGVQFFSLLMILIACTGIFLPLEVALNQAWGVTKSRNYLANQVVAFGLAIVMVVLGMSSIALNAVARAVLDFVTFHHTENFICWGLNYILMAASTGVAAILFFFSIYWLLPNRKVPWRSVLNTSIYTGIIWLVARYLFTMLLPHLDLEEMYGPFYVSVGLIFWAYTSGLILFAGAQFSVARWSQTRK